jgi:DNA-binding response OmpR family regulator
LTSYTPIGAYYRELKSLFEFCGKKCLKRLFKIVTSQVKILIIENDLPLARIMAHLLSDAGCEVEVAPTGRSGIESAKVNKFDLITLSVDLPDITGFGVCSDIKQRYYSRFTPIVFVSRRTCLEDQHHGLEIGAADYIIKPFVSSEFAPRIFAHIKTKTESHFIATTESAKA